MKIRSHLIFSLLFAAFAQSLSAQQSLNFGLAYPQPKEELPKSKAPFQTPVRIPKTEAKPMLRQISATDYRLEKGWEMASSETVTGSPVSIFDTALDTGKWYDAVVPGTVLSTLVAQGVYPDPYWGLNNLSIPDTLCRTDWWYRFEFGIPQQEAGKRTFVRFDGINYKAEVWVNYRLAGKIAGAFSRGEFDITAFIRNDKPNVLAVRILPPNNPGIPQEQNEAGHGSNGGVLCLDGPTFISSEGWDWMPGIRDRNIGIWQPVTLSFRRDITLADPRVTTDLPLPDTSSAKVNVQMNVRNDSDHPGKATIALDMEGIHLSKSVDLAARSSRSVEFSADEFPALNIANPRLWWPNGYGSPELYEMTLTATGPSGLSDSRKVRFGIREFEYDLSLSTDAGIGRYVFNPLEAYKDGVPVLDNLGRKEAKPGIWVPAVAKGASTPGITPTDDVSSAPYIVLKVNGVPIYCKGGNWGMDDAMKRVSRQRLEPYIRLHREQGFTMIRNWTAESTEEVFYELCDEYGIMVFNDFGMSTENYNLLPADYNLVLSNIRQIVTRFRNHPSIALWCPMNESFAPEYLENGISRIIAAEDGTRHYIGNSRRMNAIKSGPWTYCQPVEYYDLAEGFANEIGSPSLPTAESVRKMMAPEDLWPIGDAWFYHDWLKGPMHNKPLISTYENGINEQFGTSSGLEEFCRKAQLINYESYRGIFEAWQSRLFNTCTGTLLWMSHPAWPSMVWQTYTWDYETPGAYFGAKKACEPMHIQYNMKNGGVQVVNTSRSDETGLTAQAEVYTLEGKRLSAQKATVNSRSNTATEALKLAPATSLPPCYFIRLVLKDKKGSVVSDNFYWMSSSSPRDFTPLNNLPATTLSGSVKSAVSDGVTKGEVKVSNKSRHVALAVKLNLRDAESGVAVLPAYFKEGYFTLLPGEERTVTFEAPSTDNAKKLKVTAEGFNVALQDLAILK